LNHLSVADAAVQARRATRSVPNGLALHMYANLYIHARNPMMYVRKEQHLELCVIRVSPAVLDLPGVVIADGNSAANWTRFVPSPGGLSAVDRELVLADWWNTSTEAKRIRSAEVLVPGVVTPNYLVGSYVSCKQAQDRFNELDLPDPRLQATIYERMFYR